MAQSSARKKSILSLNEANRNLLRFANEKRKAGLFNDVSIQVGNERFPCNKMVLSYNSTYFQAKFNSEMQETQPDIVEIQGIEQNCIKMFIAYMYGEEVVIDNENVFQALAAAEHFKIMPAKLFCIEFLKSGLNTANSLDILNAYTVYVPEISADHIYQFISDNFAAIYPQQKFKNMPVNDLHVLLEELNKRKLDQQLLFMAVVSWVSTNRENRKFEFASLFQLIDLSKLSQTLVRRNADSLNAVLAAFFESNKSEDQSERDPFKILCLGGDQQYSVTELHNTSNSGNSVATYPRLPLNLTGHSAVKVNNFVFCIGGTVFRPLMARYCTSSAFLMDLSSQNLKWKEVVSMNERRSHHCSAFFKGRIVVSGGQRSNEPLKSVENYEVITNKWNIIQSMTTCRSGHAMTVCNNRLYALGGVADKSEQLKLRSVEIISELDGMWETGVQMNKARYRFAAVCLGGEIYAIGGQSGKGIEKTVEKFEPGKNRWCYVSDMNYARRGHAACVFGEKIFVVGGRSRQKGESKEKVLMIESYDPVTDSWLIISKDQIYELYGHSLVVV